MLLPLLCVKLQFLWVCLSCKVSLIKPHTIVFSRDELLSIYDEMATSILPDDMLVQIRHQELNVIPATVRGHCAGKHVPDSISVVPPSARGFNHQNPIDIPFEQEIPIIVSANVPTMQESTNNVCQENLVDIPLEKKSHKPSLLKLSFMNTWSLWNKT